MGRGPYQIHEFVGQKEVLAPVLRIQDGAMARGEPSPHMLFRGTSGTGKSLASATLGKRAGTTVIKFVGKATPPEVATRLVGMKPCDIAFFDEAHRLPEDAQELLFEVIDAGQIPGHIVNPAGPKEPVTIPPITLIFATDRPGKLLNALLKRIPLVVRFRAYRLDELREIVALIADRRKVLLSPQAAGRLAQVCHGLPRRAEHHVDGLRLTFEDSERRQLGAEDVREYLSGLRIDEDGFGEDERLFVRFLRRNRSASVETLAGYLGTDIDYVKAQVEQALRFRGLVTVGHRGRVLTKKGREWAKINLPTKPSKGGARE
jgi:holliday junction DNA helicase RuvB